MSQSDSQGSAEKPQPAGASGRATATRRQLRPRSAQRPLVDEHPELDALLGREEEGGRAGTPRQLDVPLLCAKVERDAPAASFAAATPADEVTATALAAAGLRRPLLVRGDDKGGTAAACSALGLRLPPAQQLTPAGLAEQLGADLEVPTIDVPTQGSGPRATLAQLAEYLAQREAAWQQAQRGGKAPPAKRRRQQAQQAQQGALAGRMLNVVSLPLAGTILEASVGGSVFSRRCRVLTRVPAALPAPQQRCPSTSPWVHITLAVAHHHNAAFALRSALQGAISPPAAVEELELVGAAWPGEDVEEQRPETLLYALMGGWTLRFACCVCLCRTTAAGQAAAKAALGMAVWAVRLGPAGAGCVSCLLNLAARAGADGRCVTAGPMLQGPLVCTQTGMWTWAAAQVRASLHELGQRRGRASPVAGRAAGKPGQAWP